jgi:protein TonB
MRPDFVLFLGLATAAHLAALPALDPAGRAGGGASGDDTVTLVASAPSALVAAWDSPPAPVTPPAMAKPATSQPPAQPTSETAPREISRPAQPQAAATVAQKPRVPQPAPAPAPPTATAAALPRPEADSAPRPSAQPGRPADTTRPTALARPEPPIRPQVATAPPAPPAPSAQAPDTAPRPAPRPAAPARPRPAQPEQAAAGRDIGKTTGPDAAPASQGVDAAARRQLMAQWGSGVHRAIARRKAYPRGTRASGTARIRLTLTDAGQLTALGVARSSGDAALDRAALDAVRAARYPAAPEELGAGPHSFTVPLSFQP